MCEWHSTCAWFSHFIRQCLVLVTFQTRISSMFGFNIWSWTLNVQWSPFQRVSPFKMRKNWFVHVHTGFPLWGSQFSRSLDWVCSWFILHLIESNRIFIRDYLFEVSAYHVCGVNFKWILETGNDENCLNLSVHHIDILSRVFYQYCTVLNPKISEVYLNDKIKSV